MNGKSKCALEFNVELLFQQPEVYFWTFTLPIVLHPKEGAVRWQNVCRELKRTFGFYGVRVFELHPSGHGLHVHVATATRFDVNEVRIITNRHGWGRIHVEQWDINECPNAQAYMSKYMSKQAKLWQGLKGMRWWAVFGQVSDKVRVKDVETQSLRRQIWDMIPSWIVSLLCGCGSGEGGLDNRRYNMCKMWLANRIYFRCPNLLGSYGGQHGKWGLKLQSLQYDFEQLRRGAVFLSGCLVGGV